MLPSQASCTFRAKPNLGGGVGKPSSVPISITQINWLAVSVPRSTFCLTKTMCHATSWPAYVHSPAVQRALGA